MTNRPLDIVVPVLNEEASIEEFYERVRRLGLALCLLRPIYNTPEQFDAAIAAVDRDPAAGVPAAAEASDAARQLPGS